MRLSAEERELLGVELAAVRDQASTTELRDLCGRILADLDGGELSRELEEPLGRLLAAGLESGRIRHAHHADGETVALRLYQRLPQGRAAADNAREVNEALRALAGQALRQVELRPRGPGRYALILNTEQASVTVWIDRNGVGVRSLEVGA